MVRSLKQASLAEKLDAAKLMIITLVEEGRRFWVGNMAFDDLYLQEQYFSKTFRLRFGLSPKQFFNTLRAERARTLLARGLTRDAVAQRIGLRHTFELTRLLARYPIDEQQSDHP